MNRIMNKQNDFLLNISSLYRYTQKYFDKKLASFNIGSGQLLFLFLIYENEGIAMQQLSSMADIDKGTTTKSIKKLVDEEYVEIISDENDKRVKKLYTTDKTRKIINELYSLRNDFVYHVTKDYDEEETDKQIQILSSFTNNARSIAPEDNYSLIKFGGIQKLTLLDYPGQVACTLFTVGCNMKCPFCHNKDLVFVPENLNYLNPDDVLDFLNKRQGIIDAVCITGGEPLLQEGLLDFLRQVKELNYKVKVDTNGLFPERLKEFIDSGLVDYIAMDIKNTFEKYALTIGLNESEQLIKTIKKSIKYLLDSDIDYEFRTTIVKEYHTKEDLIEIAKYIKDAKNYYLQQFVDSGKCIKEGLNSYNTEEMQELYESVKEIIPDVQLRGV